MDRLNKKTSANVPTHEQIEDRAFHLYWDRRVDREKADWRDAEAQLFEEMNPGHNDDVDE